MHINHFCALQVAGPLWTQLTCGTSLVRYTRFSKERFEYLTRAWKVVVKHKSVTSDYKGHKNLGWASNTYYSVQCIPKQFNSSDCGVFVTLYARAFCVMYVAPTNLKVVKERLQEQ